MRICLVSREFSPRLEGGVGDYTFRMSRALADAGHEVHVLTAALPGGSRMPPGVQVHSVRDGLEPGFAGAFPLAPSRHACSVHQTLLALHERQSFDYIEFPESDGEGVFALRARRTLGAYASAVLGVRLHLSRAESRRLNHLDALDMECAEYEHMEATCLGDADLLISPTRARLDDLAASGWVLAPRQVVIPPPFATTPPTAISSPPTAPPVVLFAGPLEHRQGVHLLVDAMQALFEKGLRAELRLAGEDTRTGPFGRSYRAWLERRIAPAWKERVRFLPPIAPDLLLGQATLCCFPSLGGTPPSALMEAMAQGCCVIASDASGMREWFEDGRDGLLFRAGDVPRLVDTLEKVLTTSSVAESLRREAPKSVQSRFAPERVVRLVEAAVTEAGPERHRVLPAPAPRAVEAVGPRVTVLVPYFNMGRYLPETLRSIRAQTFQDFEIVVVDDGSTDEESLELLEHIQAPDLRVVRKRNGGLSSARNAGLREARGRYILPLDPDDLIAPTFLEKTLPVLEGTPGMGYVTSLVSYFVESPTRPVGGWVPWGVERDALWVANVASTCTALMERHRLEEVGGYDEWLTSYEDWDVFCTLAERGLGGAVIPEPLFHYRLRPDSMTRTTDTEERYQLLAYLYRKHPRLALHPDRALRILQGEAHKQANRLREAAVPPAQPPLLDKVVDRVNGTLKRFDFVHHALRGAAHRVVGTEGDDRPLRHQLLERLRGKPPRR
ncbi:glycosyltransferase [Myxococcus stipitatus]|uniref:glycosyltransferase n=1 Tax=Myxococcus stipitatus TaxID=83455 RepID=UPI001F3BD1D7|nr:glycosyltransferase [Myxococcus stipitatus]MCE9672705.1 glycosyltransferase [Myxococcus stipitatus]